MSNGMRAVSDDLIQQLKECANVCQDQGMVGDAHVMRESAAEIARLLSLNEAQFAEMQGRVDRAEAYRQVAVSHADAMEIENIHVRSLLALADQLADAATSSLHRGSRVDAFVNAIAAYQESRG